MLFRNKQNKVCGELKDGIYRKKVSMKKHLLIRMDAWGIDSEIVWKLPKETVIEVFDTDNAQLYTTTRETLMNEGREEELGAGRQIFLPRSSWTLKDKQDAK